MEYHSTIKRNQLLINATKWMILKNITVSEKSKTHTHKTHMVWFYVYDMSKKRKTCSSRKHIRGCLELGVGTRIDSKWHKVSGWGNGNGLKLDCIVVMVAQLSKFTNIHWIVHLKWLNFMVCKVYLNKALLKREKRSNVIPFFKKQEQFEREYKGKL